MFRNFIVLAYRHFVRSPLTSTIEIFGMTAGLTVFLLVLLWVFNETSYDNFNKKTDQIYRLEVDDPNVGKSALLPPIIAPLLKDNLPEIEQFTRFRCMNSGTNISVINEHGTKELFETGQNVYTDNSFFETFSVEFIVGNPKTALSEKNTAVITESLARTIFGNQDPMGKILEGIFTVTGVIKDMPNFHIPFKMLRSLITREDRFNKMGYNGLNHLSYSLFPTYFLVNKNQDIAQLEKKINAEINIHLPESEKKAKGDQSFHLRELKNIYLDGGIATERGYAVHGDKPKIIAYASIALFTLLLACINFINLNSAKSLERAKEVGIKKVSGASRANVFVQFLGEIFILCVISMILALIFTHTLLPRFNELVAPLFPLVNCLVL